jgi:hypothetical protein
MALKQPVGGGGLAFSLSVDEQEPLRVLYGPLLSQHVEIWSFQETK